jgi:hypothetical protein
LLLLFSFFVGCEERSILVYVFPSTMGMESQACVVDEPDTRKFFVELTCRNVVYLMIPLTSDPRDVKHFQNTARLIFWSLLEPDAHRKMVKEMILNHHCF